MKLHRNSSSSLAPFTLPANSARGDVTEASSQVESHTSLSKRTQLLHRPFASEEEEISNFTRERREIVSPSFFFSFFFFFSSSRSKLFFFLDVEENFEEMKWNFVDDRSERWTKRGEERKSRNWFRRDLDRPSRLEIYPETSPSLGNLSCTLRLIPIRN